MTDKSLQKGWQWELVKDLDYWLLPDGFVMNLPYIIGKPPKKIFDLGCGVGRHTIYFASLGYEVSALDISQEAVKRTKDWLTKEGLEAQVSQGKMTELKYPDLNFDLVLAYNVIYHAYKEDLKKTISEIYRILKPGGYFYGTMLTKDPNKPFINPKGVIDEQTIIKLEEPEKGVPHFFSYMEDILEFFKDFEIKDIYYKEWYSAPFTLKRINDKKGNGHYIVSVQKPK